MLAFPKVTVGCLVFAGRSTSEAFQNKFTAARVLTFDSLLMERHLVEPHALTFSSCAEHLTFPPPATPSSSLISKSTRSVSSSFLLRDMADCRETTAANSDADERQPKSTSCASSSASSSSTDDDNDEGNTDDENEDDTADDDDDDDDVTDDDVRE